MATIAIPALKAKTAILTASELKAYTFPTLGRSATPEQVQAMKEIEQYVKEASDNEEVPETIKTAIAGVGVTIEFTQPKVSPETLALLENYKLTYKETLQGTAMSKSITPCIAVDKGNVEYLVNGNTAPLQLFKAGKAETVVEMTLEGVITEIQSVSMNGSGSDFIEFTLRTKDESKSFRTYTSDDEKSIQNWTSLASLFAAKVDDGLRLTGKVRSGAIIAASAHNTAKNLKGLDGYYLPVRGQIFAPTSSKRLPQWEVSLLMTAIKAKMENELLAEKVKAEYNAKFSFVQEKMGDDSLSPEMLQGTFNLMSMLK